MFHIILYNPEIPPNTGNIMRLAANTGTQLHLIRPLGFNLSDNSLKRAGLDYKKDADYFLHDNFDICLNSIKFNQIYAFTKFATKKFTSVKFKRNDCFLFGTLFGAPSAKDEAVVSVGGRCRYYFIYFYRQEAKRRNLY